MNIANAEGLRHFLGDLSKEGMRVFAYDDGSGGFYEVDDVREVEGYVMLHLGDFHHSLPNESNAQEDGNG